MIESPYADDLEEQLQERGRWRPPALTLILGSALLLGVGFLGGALVQRSAGGATSSAQPGAGTPGFAGRQASGSMTSGTVKLVSGKYVYVKTSGGSVVKVKVSGKTTLRITRPGKMGQLKPGDQIVAQGAKDAKGTVDATSVNSGDGVTESQGGGQMPGGGQTPGGGRRPGG